MHISYAHSTVVTGTAVITRYQVLYCERPVSELIERNVARLLLFARHNIYLCSGALLLLARIQTAGIGTIFGLDYY